MLSKKINDGLKTTFWRIHEEQLLRIIKEQELKKRQCKVDRSMMMQTLGENTGLFSSKEIAQTCCQRLCMPNSLHGIDQGLHNNVE